MGKKVLIVDDSATVRKQVTVALSEAGFDVVEAVDGLDGLEKSAQTPDLALVVSDINMPRMNGIQMLQSLKKDPKHANVPVVVLTTEGQPELIQSAKSAGAKGWIVKPFKPAMLVAAVKRLTGG
jgi:two-component system, chemotaxis family, chemotaxis protein CheY